MNNKDAWMLAFSIVFLVFVALLFIRASKTEQVEMAAHIPVPEVTEVARQDITFIIGEDKNVKNPFYQYAEQYFKTHPDVRTDLVITDESSLEGMMNRLEKIYVASQRKFDKINLVVHSNPWSGISMPLVEGGNRINKELLQNALENDSIFSDYKMIDQNTNIYIHACGLGQNTELVKDLKQVIATDEARAPSLMVSPQYVNFSQEEGLFTKKNMTAYYAFFPTAYRPANLHLARQLREKYPEAEVDWLQALGKDLESNGSGAFSYTYNIPVEWTIEYPEYDVPALENEMDKMEWLMNQDELLDIIDKIGIPFDYFRWRIKKGSKVDQDYIEVPYIQVKGKVTVICILKAQEEGKKDTWLRV